MEWFIRAKQDSTYPDIYTYDIMETNPDAGKSGVVYSGDALFICNTDHKHSAHLISAAPSMYEALNEIYNAELNADTLRILAPWFDKVEKILSKAEGK